MLEVARGASVLESRADSTATCNSEGRSVCTPVGWRRGRVGPLWAQPVCAHAEEGNSLVLLFIRVSLAQGEAEQGAWHWGRGAPSWQSYSQTP